MFVKGFSLTPLFKTFVSTPLFSVPSPFQVFQTVPPSPTLTQPSCPNRTNEPSRHIINRFKQISKGWFYQFNCRFLSKINFWYFKFLSKVMLFYGIFSGSFIDISEWLFFIKLWWQKIFFLQMHNTILQRVK